MKILQVRRCTSGKVSAKNELKNTENFEITKPIDMTYLQILFPLMMTLGDFINE